MKNVLRLSMVALAMVAFSASTARAAFIDVDMSGWGTFTGYDIPGGLNSGVTVNIGAGSTVTSVEYFDVEFEAISPSWGSELVLSVNDDNGLGVWWDWSPDTTDSPGVYGPFTGVFGSAPGVPGPFGEGGSFTSATGDIWATAYEAFNDGGNAQDTAILRGTLRINYTAIPEPSSALLGLMSLGLIAIRRRRA